MNLEEKLSKCIDDKGIALTVVSRRTGISYMALYDSLRNKSKKRDIIRKRDGRNYIKGRKPEKELVSLCKFLDVDPREFADKEVI